jgi:hypothetical protein
VCFCDLLRDAQPHLVVVINDHNFDCLHPVG